jgi:16S rRNA (guanine527-N7)-methyltransferase
MKAGMAREEASFRATVGRLAEAWSIPCAGESLDALTAFASLLMKWNARINLTGASSIADLADEHLVDSFALGARFDPASAFTAVDVGSGGGLPAIPLAILRPALALRLIEPVAKKAAFLRTAARELGLTKRVAIEVGRAEALVPGQFDVAFSRATLSPESWAGLGAQLVRPAGRVYVLASTSAATFSPPTGTKESGRWSYFEDRRTLIELSRLNETAEAVEAAEAAAPSS